MERAPKTAVDYAGRNCGPALLFAAGGHHAGVIPLLADRGANMNIMTGQTASPVKYTPLRVAVGATAPGGRPRNPDPDGTREVATVRALLRHGAGMPPPAPPRSPAPGSVPRGTLFETTYPRRISLLNTGSSVRLTRPRSNYPSQSPIPSKTGASRRSASLAAPAKSR